MPATMRLYTKTNIVTATFFGGPLAAASLGSQNFRMLGHDRAARNSLLVGSAYTIVMFAGLIPWLGTLSILILIQIWQTLMAAMVVQDYQERQIKEHLEKGGQKAEMVQVVLVSIVALVATILVFVLGKVLWS